MGDKKKYPRALASEVATWIAGNMRNAVEQMEFAGSFRRLKLMVGDLEVLYVSKLVTMPTPGDMFATGTYSAVDVWLDEQLKAGVITKRLSETGNPAWGPKNKLAIHTPTGLPIDFFATTIPNWWVSLVIRTGSAETNMNLTTAYNARGWSLNAYGCGYTDRGRVIPLTSERAVFETVGLKYLEPDQR